MNKPSILANGDGSESRQNEQGTRSEAECQSREYKHDDCISTQKIDIDGGEGVSPPYVLVYNTNSTVENQHNVGGGGEIEAGAGGIRTPYLLTASQTFSQVNYGPVNAS